MNPTIATSGSKTLKALRKHGLVAIGVAALALSVIAGVGIASAKHAASVPAHQTDERTATSTVYFETDQGTRSFTVSGGDGGEYHFGALGNDVAQAQRSVSNALATSTVFFETDQGRQSFTVAGGDGGEYHFGTLPVE